MIRPTLLGLVILSLAAVACRRPTPPPTVPAPPPPTVATQPAPPPPTPKPTQPTSGIPRPDLRVGALDRLRSIGLAYQTAAIDGPPSGPEALGREIKLKSPRDNQDFVIIWKLDPNRLDKSKGQPLIAWEATADSQGGRCVLRADFGAQYMTGAEFDAAPKAKSPNAD